MKLSPIRNSFIVPLQEVHKVALNEVEWSRSVGGYHSFTPPEGGPRRTVFVWSVEALTPPDNGEMRARVTYSDLVDETKKPNLPFSRKTLLAAIENCLASSPRWEQTLKTVGIDELARKLSVPSLLRECTVTFVTTGQPYHLTLPIETVRQALVLLDTEGELRFAL